jgi:hypothetical protein
MPAIKPRTTQKHVVRHITRLYRANNETLFAYAKFMNNELPHQMIERRTKLVCHFAGD